MHDGVAQGSSGSATSSTRSIDRRPGATTRELAISAAGGDHARRVRLKVLHLRSPPRGLAGHPFDSLADYATRVGVQLRAPSAPSLDESGAPLSARTQTEMLRIAQEAIGNVRVTHRQPTCGWCRPRTLTSQRLRGRVTTGSAMPYPASTTRDFTPCASARAPSARARRHRPDPAAGPWWSLDPR